MLPCKKVLQYTDTAHYDCALNLIAFAKRTNMYKWNVPTHGSMVGKRVCRYWHQERRYFAGTATLCRMVGYNLIHYVKYDDGEEHWESELEELALSYMCNRSSACWKRAGHRGRCLRKATSTHACRFT